MQNFAISVLIARFNFGRLTGGRPILLDVEVVLLGLGRDRARVAVSADPGRDDKDSQHQQDDDDLLDGRASDPGPT